MICELLMEYMEEMKTNEWYGVFRSDMYMCAHMVVCVWGLCVCVCVSGVWERPTSLPTADCKTINYLLLNVFSSFQDVNLVLDNSEYWIPYKHSGVLALLFLVPACLNKPSYWFSPSIKISWLFENPSHKDLVLLGVNSGDQGYQKIP